MGYKITEIFSIQETQKNMINKFTKRLIELESQFNSLNFDTFLTKNDLEKYKLEVNCSIETVKCEADNNFLIKEIA